MTNWLEKNIFFSIEMPLRFMLWMSVTALGYIQADF